VARHTYVFAGPPGSLSVLMTIIETAIGRPFIREPGSDPYIRADPIGVYVARHDFEDGDIDAPDGTPIPLQTGYPYLADIRDTERDLHRQQQVAAAIFAAIKADERLKAVYVDDMQHVLDMTEPDPRPSG
jgi:hypothetical protein